MHIIQVSRESAFQVLRAGGHRQPRQETKVAGRGLASVSIFDIPVVSIVFLFCGLASFVLKDPTR